MLVNTKHGTALVIADQLDISKTASCKTTGWEDPHARFRGTLVFMSLRYSLG